MSIKRGPPRRSLLERFTEKWQIDPERGCWLWQGSTAHGASKHQGGYGLIGRGGRGVTILAHRASYELHKGHISEGLHIDHLCGERSCVNPNHLEAVTPQENHRRYTDSVRQCPYGHPYDYNNTYITPTRSRFCRACDRDRHKESRRAALLPGESIPVSNANKTHCIYGHPFDDQLTSTGKRQCRECARRRNRKAYAKRVAARGAQ